MFCAYQQWRSAAPSAGPPRARIMRMGAANRLAQVAEWRAAAPRNPDAEKDGITPRRPRPRSPTRTSSTGRWRGTGAAPPVGGRRARARPPSAMTLPAKGVIGLGHLHALGPPGGARGEHHRGPVAPTGLGPLRGGQRRGVEGRQRSVGLVDLDHRQIGTARFCDPRPGRCRLWPPRIGRPTGGCARCGRPARECSPSGPTARSTRPAGTRPAMPPRTSASWSGRDGRRRPALLRARPALPATRSTASSKSP